MTVLAQRSQEGNPTAGQAPQLGCAEGIGIRERRSQAQRRDDDPTSFRSDLRDQLGGARLPCGVRRRG